MFRKVYVGLPMDHSVVVAMKIVHGLGLPEDEYRVEYDRGLTTLYVAVEQAGTALDALVAGDLLTCDEAWNHFIARPVAPG